MFRRKERDIISHYSRCGNVASRCSKGKRGKMPPHQCPPGSICGVFGLSFGCHFAPKGGAEGAFLNIWECRQSMFKTKNATCYHIFEHRAMLSVGVSKEEGQHYITFVKMRECSQQMFKRKNAARCPPSMPPDRFLEHFASLLDVTLSPRGGGRGMTSGYV